MGFLMSSVLFPPPQVSSWRLYGRYLLVGLHLAQGLLRVALLFPWCSEASKEHQKKTWARTMLNICGVRTRCCGSLPPLGQPCLLVPNHISWLDIYVLMAYAPVRFVAKSEVRRWPVVGWLAHQIGTVFVERGNKAAIDGTLKTLHPILADGGWLVIFAEGTSTDGTEIKPFKSSLIQAALDTDTDVVPVLLRYPRADGSPNFSVGYHGDITMGQSVRAVLGEAEHYAEVTLFTPLPEAERTNRTAAAEAARAILLRALEEKTGQIPQQADYGASWPEPCSLEPPSALQ